MKYNKFNVLLMMLKGIVVLQALLRPLSFSTFPHKKANRTKN